MEASWHKTGMNGGLKCRLYQQGECPQGEKDE